MMIRSLLVTELKKKLQLLLKNSENWVRSDRSLSAPLSKSDPVSLVTAINISGIKHWTTFQGYQIYTKKNATLFDCTVCDSTSFFWLHSLVITLVTLAITLVKLVFTLVIAGSPRNIARDIWMLSSRGAGTRGSRSRRIGLEERRRTVIFSFV